MNSLFGVSILVISIGVLYWALCIHGSKTLNPLLRYQSKILFVIICLSLFAIKVSPYLALLVLLMFTLLLYKTDLFLPIEMKVRQAIQNGDLGRLETLLKKSGKIELLSHIDFLDQATAHIGNSTVKIVDLLITKLKPNISKQVMSNVAFSGDVTILKLIMSKANSFSSSEIREIVVSAKMAGTNHEFLELIMEWAKERLSASDRELLQNFLHSNR